MFPYIIKSTFCLVLLLAFYHFVLEKEKMHRFNRFYLIGAILFSFIVPSFIITVPPIEFVEPFIIEQSIDNSSQAFVTTKGIDYTNYLFGVYSLISGILLFFLGIKIFRLVQKIRRNKKVNYFKATVVLLKEQIAPYTFLSYIFINKTEYQNDSLEQQILTHELTHVEQKHTIDVLYIEVLQNLFWFNPIFRYYKKAIQLNHEFLADEAVINSHKNITEYQHLLLNKTAQQNNIYLASNFNYSFTKKRLLMMKTSSTKAKILLKKLAIIPLIAGFTFAFAQRVEAQEKKPQVVEVVLKKDKSLTKKGMKEYKKLFNAGKKTKIYKLKNLEKMIALYKAMSKKQQKSVTDIRKTVPPPPPRPLKIEVIEKEETPKVRELEEVVELEEVKEAEEIDLIEEREVVDLIEVRELEEVEEVEVVEVREIEIREVVVHELEEYKKKHGIKSIPPPPSLKKNATKKEIERYNKAYKYWKKKMKNIPPPPPPMKPLDYAIKMANKGAIFKYNGKKISSDKAIDLLKENKKLNIATIDKKSKTPIVHISNKPMVVEVPIK